MIDSSRRMWPRSDLRVGDADRQAVVAELQRHYVEGRLTSEELGERVSQALAARTFADFSPLLQDLPTLKSEDQTALEPRHEMQTRGETHFIGPPLGAILLIIGMLALIWVFMMPGMRGGFFFPWPLLIWGFFIFGRPFRGRRF